MSFWKQSIEYGLRIVERLVDSSIFEKITIPSSSTNNLTEASLALEKSLINHLDGHANDIKNTVKISIKSAIKDATLSLERSISAEGDRVINKIESDQQEKLVSIVKLANFYLEIEDYENAVRLSPDLILLSDYSRNRVQEGKMQWLSPWIISQSTWITLMSFGSPSEKVKIAVDAKFKDFRLDLLDLLGVELVTQKICSWIDISEFVNNQGNKIIPKLINAAQTKYTIPTEISVEEEISIPTKGHPIICPEISVLSSTAKVVKWLVSAGSSVKTDQPLVEIETEKVVIEVTSPSFGKLKLIKKIEGDEVQSGDTLGFIA